MTKLQQVMIITLFSSLFSVSAEELQRLFTTPVERQQLNRERDDPKQPDPPPPEPEPLVLPELPKLPPQITVNGLIKRSRGDSTVWINEVPQTVPKAGSQTVQESFTIDFNKIDSFTVPIIITKNGQKLPLKPGQTIDTVENKVGEHFNLTNTLDKSQK